MRTKVEILRDLNMHAAKVDPQHQDLAQVAMIETEVQIDIRDILHASTDADQKIRLWNLQNS